jgi:hypothetical protein
MPMLRKAMTYESASGICCDWPIRAVNGSVRRFKAFRNWRASAGFSHVPKPKSRLCLLQRELLCQVAPVTTNSRDEGFLLKIRSIGLEFESSVVS